LRSTDLVVGVEWNEMEIADSADADIAGLTADSRKVEPGYLFAAFEGAAADGRAFIPDALAKGAAGVLTHTGTPRDDASAIWLTHDQPRRAYAQLAARLYAPQPENIAAVTGTNGKSSVAEFTRQILAHVGLKAASLGTLGVIGPDGGGGVSLTTPDPVDLHKTLCRLAGDGISHVALEASSHGLDQFRLDGGRISAAAFTNLSRDHLDYHPDMEAYFAAKARLFTELLASGGTAVLNADDAHGQALIETCRGQELAVISYGWKGEDIRLGLAHPAAHGQTLSLSFDGDDAEISLPLIGDFQAANALCALGLARAISDVSIADGLAALEKLTGAPGRLERAAQLANGAAVYVDYAHTPDALQTVLTSLRPHASGRLALVFGCGGDRDAGKRPQMGEIAARLADQVIVTDDNPRTEAAAEIRRQILDACTGAREIADRETAIFEAVSQLRAGDLLVVAGKGHEQGQIVGSDVLPFDDADVSRRAAKEAGA